MLQRILHKSKMEEGFFALCDDIICRIKMKPPVAAIGILQQEVPFDGREIRI